VDCKIRDTLIRGDNVQISRPVSLFLKRYNATGVIDDQNRGNCAKVRKKLTEERLQIIDQQASKFVKKKKDCMNDLFVHYLNS
jgi:hypothetical protein